MKELPEEAVELLQELRSNLANSNDPWEQRRELMLKIDGLIGGGESDMFVASVREMGRIGANYAQMMQTFGQMFAQYPGSPNLAEFFGKGMGGNPFVQPPMYDFFKQFNDFLSAQSKALTNPGDKR